MQSLHSAADTPELWLLTPRAMVSRYCIPQKSWHYFVFTGPRRTHARLPGLCHLWSTSIQSGFRQCLGVAYVPISPVCLHWAHLDSYSTRGRHCSTCACLRQGPHSMERQDQPQGPHNQEVVSFPATNKGWPDSAPTRLLPTTAHISPVNR